jgi:hypothetical protein
MEAGDQEPGFLPRLLCIEPFGESVVGAGRQVTGFAGLGVASSSSSFVEG